MDQQQIDRLETRLTRYDQQIREMEAMASQSPLRMSESFAHDLEALRRRRKEARGRMARMRLEEAESWENETLETGINDILDDIGSRIQRVFSREKH